MTESVCKVSQAANSVEQTETEGGGVGGGEVCVCVWIVVCSTAFTTYWIQVVSFFLSFFVALNNNWLSKCYEEAVFVVFAAEQEVSVQQRPEQRRSRFWSVWSLMT